MIAQELLGESPESHITSNAIYGMSNNGKNQNAVSDIRLCKD